MRFSEIEKVTHVGSYNVNIPLRDLPDMIHKWEKDDFYQLQMCPDFQRGHVWSEEQQICFVENVLRGVDPGVIYFNFPSWYGPESSDYNDFVCVDGLQRITAIMRFIENEIPAFDTLYQDYKDRLHTSVDVVVNINNLKTRREVLKWYLELNWGGTPHTEDELEQVEELLRVEEGR